MPCLLLKRERIYKLKCCSEHLFDVFPASSVYFFLPIVPKILFRDPCGSKEIDSIKVLGPLTLMTDSGLAM